MEGFQHGTFGNATGEEYVNLILKLLAEDETPQTGNKDDPIPQSLIQ